MTRRRRFALIGGLLLLIVALAWLWNVIQVRFPNIFDRETTDTAELEKLKKADLRQRAVNGTNWPQFYGPNRDGVVPAPELNIDWAKKAPAKLWSVPIGGGYSSFAVVDGLAYTMDKIDNQERIVCLDTATGATRWTYDREVTYRREGTNFLPGPRSTPSVHDGKLYTVGAMGQFVCLQLATTPTGKPVLMWEKDLVKEWDVALPTWSMACSALIEGDLVIVQPGGKKGTVVAYDRTSGEVRWAAGNEPTGYSSPVVATLGGKRQIVAVSGKNVLGLQASDGKVLWKQSFITQHDANIALPVIAGDFVFVSASYNRGCACFAVEPGGQSAKPVYVKPNKLMRNHIGSSIHRGGFIFGYDNTVLACVNLREGTAVEDWMPADQESKLERGCVLLLGDSLLSLSERGTLSLGKADGKGYTPQGRLANVLSGGECWALPVYVQGKLFLRDGEKAVCLDLRKD
jgi:outer membrane protein assembly factor BamB